MNRLALVLTLSVFATASSNGQTFFTNCISNTGNDATLIVDASGAHVLGSGSFQSGDEIGIFTEDGQCVGVGAWTGQNIAISIWGDDPMLSDKSGLLPEESFMVRVWDKSANQLYGTSYGTVTYQLASTAPFRGSATYAPNALYMTTKIEAIGTSTTTGKNKIRTKGRKTRTQESGANNTAIISVSRTGPFNDEMEVLLEFSGDADNGTDYEALSTSVTFESGQKTAYILLQPVADNLIEGDETVTLTLRPSGAYDLASSESETTTSLVIEDSDIALGTTPEESQSDFMLAAPYPNPFESNTTIRFHTAETQALRVDVYNVIGRKVASIFDGTIQAGVDHEFVFNANGLPGGLYLIKATGKQTTVRSATLKQ